MHPEVGLRSCNFTYLCPQILGNEYVAGLEVTMDVPNAMNVLHACRNISDNGELLRPSAKFRVQARLGAL